MRLRAALLSALVALAACADGDLTSPELPLPTAQAPEAPSNTDPSAVLDFEEFTSTVWVGTSYSAQGYTLLGTPTDTECAFGSGGTEPPELTVVASDEPRFYGGSTGMLINDVCEGEVSLTNDDSLAFALASIDLAATVFNPSVQVTLIGTTAAGDHLSATFSVSSPEYETYPVGWENLVEVSWKQGADFAIHTFDEVVLEATEPEDQRACEDGLWAQYGFRNQGQCKRTVLTGRDKR